ncbi:MAG: glycosyltransferase family 4 protein [Thermodesulfobacteriota bacterium]|nr:glycosyltransferase family 4 protein [Thermodesulfobacteriota bacterium]
MKPRILIIVDVPGWALERTADNVIARLKDHYSFEKAFNINAVEKIRNGHFDLLYISYWRQFRDANIKENCPPNTVSGIRSHFKWDGCMGLPPSPEVIESLQKFVALNVPSLILYDIFKNLHPALFHTPHGVDHLVFHPGSDDPCNSPQGKLVIGWAGSKTNHPGKRGIDDYILPAIKSISGVTFKIAAREIKWRNQEEMVDFYQSLDAYICSSRTEGGPHPLLEASSCGIPVISTKVGIAPELIEENVNGILIERSVPAIRDAIIRLRDNRELRLFMGRQARKTIEERWTWDIQAQNYYPFFNYGLERINR